MHGINHQIGAILSLTVAGFLWYVPAHAQAFRCSTPDGKVSFSDTPCQTGATSAPVYIERSTPPPSGPQHTEGPEVRELNTMISQALAQRDYARAERLAVTQKQWDMIRAAKGQDSAAKARIAQEKPKRTVCNTSGYAQQGGVYSGTTICRER